jgi:hypothetical protein
MARRRTASGRGGRGGGQSWGEVVMVLIALVLAIALAGAAAFVTVPATLVLLVLVCARPNGAGASIRRWSVWRRLRGLEPTRGRATFAAALAIYGVVIPGACLSLLVTGIRSETSGRPSGAPGVAVTQSTDTPAPAATDAPTVAPTPTAAPPLPVAPPTAAPPADPCHVGGVTYCALNPRVTQATIGSTICVLGWTATVRPPESYTYDLKKQQIAQEGLPGGTRNYEEDHRMPLELGGAPSDVMNLSPESPPSPNPKDSDETSLKYHVCDGRMALVQAQHQMVSTWLAGYPGYRR